jgi:hypothetical protein
MTSLTRSSAARANDEDIAEEQGRSKVGKWQEGRPLVRGRLNAT